MPDAVDSLRREQVMRSDSGRICHRGLGRLMWPRGLELSQHPLHGGAADLDAGAKHLPGHRARAELRFRAEMPKFLHGPPNCIVDAVPDHGPLQQTRPGFAFGRPDPGADRIAVDDKVLRGLPEAPTAGCPITTKLLAEVYYFVAVA